MDFDDLKRAWHDCDDKLDSGIHLNARRLRSILRLNSEARGNRSTPGGIDYTVPVILAQRHMDTHWIARIHRSAAAWIREACRVDEVTGRLHTSVMRMFGRHRTLRG
jgi:hypothetical protein